MPRPGRKRRSTPREPNGRAQRNSRAEQEATMRTALEARARHAGVTLTADTAAALRQPWMGSKFGRAMAAYCAGLPAEPKPPTVQMMWEYYSRFMAIRTAYLATVDAPAPWPKSARLGDAPPPGDAAEEVRHDPRSPEERAIAAHRAYDAVLDALRAIDGVALVYLLQAAEHDDPLAIPDAVPVLRGLGERMGW